jgi:tripartite-type tricarboxylate transporter receptor subunit TctC
MLNGHVVRAAHAPEVAERLAREDTEIVASTPEVLRSTVAAESALWAKVIKEMGIALE